MGKKEDEEVDLGSLVLKQMITDGETFSGAEEKSETLVDRPLSEAEKDFEKVSCLETASGRDAAQKKEDALKIRASTQACHDDDDVGGPPTVALK